MGNRAPDAIGIMIDAQNADRYPRPLRGTSPLRIAAQAIYAAIQGDENAIGIHHTDTADIPVPYSIPAQCLLVWIFGGLLLAGLYTLFNTTIIPQITEKITEMFSYSGS